MVILILIVILITNDSSPLSSRQKGPSNPEEKSSVRRETSIRKGLHSTFATLFSY